MQALVTTTNQSSTWDQFNLIAFRRGEVDAFRDVYDRMVKPLLYFVGRMIDSPPDAEDIVANAFYKLYHKRAQMQHAEHIKRWLYVVVRNESIDLLRNKEKMREVYRDMTYTSVVEPES